MIYLDKKQDEFEKQNNNNYPSSDDRNSIIDNENNISIDSYNSFMKLNSMFWLIAFICCFLYGAFLPFNYIASGFLTNTIFKDIKDKKIAQEKAGVYMSIPFMISGFLVPIFGLIIDRYGQRAYLTLFSSILGLISFASLYFIHPLFSLILLGITYSLFASVIWPAISLVVDKKDIVINKIYLKILIIIIFKF